MSMSSQFVVPTPPENDDLGPFDSELAERLDAFLRGETSTQSQVDDPLFITIQPAHSELVEAIDSGDAARVKDELNACRDHFHPDVGVMNALDHAITSGQMEIVRLLIENGVPVDPKILTLVAMSGHIPVLEFFPKHFQWPIDKELDSGNTIFTAAAEHENVVRWLLSRGASVNNEDGHSETPLSRAVQSGSRPAIKLLLDAGADVSLGAPLQASLVRKKSHKDLGLTYGALDLTKQLLELGVPVNKFIGEGSRWWEWAGFERSTALHAACHGVHRNLDAVRLLLAHGADPTLNQRARGEELPNTSPLNYALGCGDPEYVAVIREHLRQRGHA